MNQQFLRRLIGFRMHACGIQWVIAVLDTHKARTLFKGFRPQLGHFQKLPAVGKPAVCLPVIHDIFRNGLCNAGNIGKQRRRCGIQIHAHPVHTVFHHTAQRFAQLFLVHIMLVLAHTDGFGINLHQFCQGILEPSCDGRGTSLAYVKFRKLFCGQLAGRIHGSPGFIHNHILYRTIQFF